MLSLIAVLEKIRTKTFLFFDENVCLRMPPKNSHQGEVFLELDHTANQKVPIFTTNS